MAFSLGCEHIYLEYAAKVVLDDVTLGLDDGARIGIVGRNGDGKSTLLAILSGQIEPEEGRVFRRNDLSIGFVAQDDNLDDSLTIKKVLFGDTPEYLWASDSKIRDICDHLIGDVSMDFIIGNLSGGQRRRVYLAQTLVKNDGILMLDEPTNHLDMASIAWLAKHLNQRWPKKSGTLLVVTHDRWFLDEVCTSMWEVHDGTVESFDGGYSAYVLQRVKREETFEVAQAKRKNLLRRELAWLSRGARARSSKPKFHVEAAKALIADEPAIRDPLELKRAAVARLGKQAVELVNVSKTNGDRLVIDDLSWIIAPGDRIGLLGSNGTGKTTLLRLIDGKAKPDSGHIKIGKTVKMATLSQRLEELDEFGDSLVREVLNRYKSHFVIDGKEVTSTQLLERLGFSHAHIQMPISKLSGGQKRRLQLMLTLLQGANVLLLDEPGNDMDIDMLSQIENVLDTWPGTLIIVTHDRHLMERTTDNQYALIDGKVYHMPGGIDQYMGIQADHDDQDVKSDVVRPDAVRSDAESTISSQKTLTNTQRQNAKRRFSAIERKMQTIEEKIEATTTKLSEADPTNYLELTAIEEEIAQLKSEQSDLEDEWLELSELLGE